MTNRVSPPVDKTAPAASEETKGAITPEIGEEQAAKETIDGQIDANRATIVLMLILNPEKLENTLRHNGTMSQMEMSLCIIVLTKLLSQFQK
jgi:hypothetical protein